MFESWKRHWGESRPRRVLAAVSGGLDSVVLLRSLWELRAALGLDLAVAHFNHHLRGDDSDADQVFVSNLAVELGLPAFEGSAQMESRAGRSATRESLEMKARRLRHAFLARTALEWGAEAVALAHHADDQAELVLIRLLRGAGGSGLGGMKRESPSPADPRIPLLRPLLDFTKRELESIARQRGWAYREDASNQDPSILRNRIRHQLLPLLEAEYQEGIREVLGRTADVVSEEASFVEETARTWIASRRRRSFEQLHVAVQRAVIRLELWELGHAGGFDLVEKLRTRTSLVSTAPGTGVRRDLSGVLESVAPVTTVSESALREDESILVPLTSATGSIPTGDGVFEWRIVTGTARSSVRRPGEELFDLESIGDSLRLRHWKSGDRFQMLGMERAARLQNLFVNRKIPAAQRRRLWLGETEGGVVAWVEGFPTGEAFKVQPASNPNPKTGQKRSRLLAVRFRRRE